MRNSFIFQLARVFLSLLIVTLFPVTIYAKSRVAIAYYGPSNHIDLLDEPPPNSTRSNRITPLSLLKKSTSPEQTIITNIKSLAPGRLLVAAHPPFGLRLISSAGKNPYLVASEKDDPFVGYTFNISPLRASIYANYLENIANLHISATFALLQPPQEEESLFQLYQSSNQATTYQEKIFVSNNIEGPIEVITLPTSEIIIASNSNTSPSFSIIDIIDTSLPEGDWWSKRQIITSDKEENILDEKRTIVPEFNHIRDIHGFGPTAPKDILVVTLTTAFRYRIGHGILWQFSPADNGFPGHLSSGTISHDGQVILAIHNPAVWTKPSSQHRILWLTPDGQYTGIHSAPLDAAPQSIDDAEGIGGTGTSNFTGVKIPLYHPSDPVTGPLQVDTLHLPKIAWIGESISGTLTLSSTLSTLHQIEQLIIYAFYQSDRDKGCEVLSPQGKREITLLQLNNYFIHNGQLTLSFESNVITDNEQGRWCPRVAYLDRNKKIDIPFLNTAPPPFEVTKIGDIKKNTPHFKKIDSGPFGLKNNDRHQRGCGGCSTLPNNELPTLLLFLFGGILSKRYKVRRAKKNNFSKRYG